MTSHNTSSSSSWGFSGVEYVRPGDPMAQLDQITSENTRANSSSASSGSSDPRRSNSKLSRPSSRRVSFSNASDVTSNLSMDSTKALVGDTTPSHSISTSHHTVSLHASRVTNPAPRQGSTGTSAARPSFQGHSSQQSSYTSAHHVPLSGRSQSDFSGTTGHSSQSSQDSRHASQSSMAKSQNMLDQRSYGSHHPPARAAPPPPQPPQPPTMASTPSSSSRETANPFRSSVPSLNHLGMPGYMGQGYERGHQPVHPPARAQVQGHGRQHSMPQVPQHNSDYGNVPYRRPTDITTSLSMSTTNDSTDHFSHSDSCWDSEEDNDSCLSTSTAATAVSDVTIGRSSGGKVSKPTQTSTATAAPLQAPTQIHSRANRAPHSPVLRRAGPVRVSAGHKSVLSTSKTTSSTSIKSAPSTHSAAKAVSSSAATAKTVNSNVNGGPTIHIEVQRPAQRTESQNDLRLRQQIEEALAGKIEQLKLEQQAQASQTQRSRSASPVKKAASVTPEEKIASIVSENKEDVTKQVQELVKLEQQKKELEKRELILAENQKLDQERKLKEEREQKERETEQKLREEREQKQRDEAKAEQDKLRAEFIEQGKMLEDIKNQLDAQAKKLESTQAERTELKDARDALEKKCSGLEKTLSHVSDKETFVVEQVASLQIIKEALQSRLGPLEEEVQVQRAELEKVTTERDGLLGDTKNQLDRIIDLEKELKTLVEDKQALITQIDALEKEKLDLNDRVKTLKTDNSELEEDLKEAEEECDALKARVEELKTAEADQKTKIEALTTERDALLVDIDGHKALAATQETSLNEVRETLSNVEAELAKSQDANKGLQAEHEEIQKLADELDEGGSNYKDLRQKNEELTAKTNELQAEADKLAPLETAKAELEERVKQLQAEADKLASLETAKTELEERVKQVQADHEAAASALVVERAEFSTTKAALNEAAAKVPGLEKQLAEKADVEARAADLEKHTSQIPQLRSENAKLAEQLDAANKLIEALSAAQQAQRVFASQTAPSPPPPVAEAHSVPPSPKIPVVPESPKLAPQGAGTSTKSRSRAPSVCRSTSSKSSKRTVVSSSRGVKDDMALVIVRNPLDRGNVQVVRKCDLRSPRSRSQPPVKD